MGLIKAIMVTLMMATAIPAETYAGTLSPAIVEHVDEMEHEERYILREGAEIYRNEDGDLLDQGHLGGTVEIVPELCTDEFAVIATCDGVAYMRAEDLGTEDPTQPKLRSLGVMKITHYCPCMACGTGNGITASGRKAEVGRTIAVNKKVAPLGAHIVINGHEYVVDDRGVGAGVVDIFVSSHSEAKKLGTYKAEVFIVEG